MPAFGAPMRAEFMLDFDKWVFANQGSYGVCPRRVVEFRSEFCTLNTFVSFLWGVKL